jgi:hypothetical protein
MLRCCFLWVTLLVVLTLFPNRVLHADEKKSWQEAELKRLEGRWTTVREEKTDQDKIRRRRVELEVAGGNLNVFVFNEERPEPWNGPPLKVIGVERGDALGSPSGLKLERAEVYYDFVGEKLIVVGGIANRTWEGFKLSGEYKRVEKPKSEERTRGDKPASKSARYISVQEPCRGLP